MSILVNKSSKVVVQGITGSEGQFHGNQMLEYGTNIVSGVTPGKGGIKALNDSIPVFNSCLLYTSPSPRDVSLSRMPSSA